MFGALPRFELGRRWRFKRDIGGEGDGDGDGDGEGERNGEGEGDGDGERDEGRRRYLKEDIDIEINKVPCSVPLTFRLCFAVFFHVLIAEGAAVRP